MSLALYLTELRAQCDSVYICCFRRNLNVFRSVDFVYYSSFRFSFLFVVVFLGLNLLVCGWVGLSLFRGWLVGCLCLSVVVAAIGAGTKHQQLHYLWLAAAKMVSDRNQELATAKLKGSFGEKIRNELF